MPATSANIVQTYESIDWKGLVTALYDGSFRQQGLCMVQAGQHLIDGC